MPFVLVQGVRNATVVDCCSSLCLVLFKLLWNQVEKILNE